MTKYPMGHITAMEYVIVSLVILAAIAVAGRLFEIQIRAMFGVAGEAVCGNHDEAARKVCERCSACADKTAVDNRWSTEERDGHAGSLHSRE